MTDRHDRLDHARRYVGNLEDAMDASDWLMALSVINKMADVQSELAIECVQKAYDSGVTKKRMATILNVPPSTFRGLEKTKAGDRGPQSLIDLLP
jgi:hypothetical protein